MKHPDFVFRHPGEEIPVALPAHCVIWNCREPRESELTCTGHRGEIRAPHKEAPKNVEARARYHARAKDPAFLEAQAKRKRDARRKAREAARAA